jgi:hypothetical protein
MPNPAFTREVLAKFLPDHESIRKFEELINATETTTTAVATVAKAVVAIPATVIDVDLAAQAAIAAAVQALNMAERVSDLVLLLATPPNREDVAALESRVRDLEVRPIQYPVLVPFTLSDGTKTVLPTTF